LAAAEHTLFFSSWSRLLALCMLVPGGCLAVGGSARVAPARISNADLVQAEETLLLAKPVAEQSECPSALSAELSPEVAARQWETIVLHHSATEGATVAAIDAAHRQRRDAKGTPWLGIGYHFVVGDGQGMPDGAIEPTFRWRGQLHGAHAGDRIHNDTGIGICLVGNFDEHSPSARQIAATKKLIADLRATYAIEVENVLVHRDLSATNCPGKFFQLNDFLSPEATSE
jgi:hypothetical protein